MVYIKFASVKLIINSIFLICLILLFSSETGLAKQKYAVQIAASKTQQNIQDLAKKYGIADSIFIVRSELWYRYLIGSFDDFEVASDYAIELVQKTKLKNVFVQVIDIETDNTNEILRKDSSVHSNKVEHREFETDSIQEISKTGAGNSLADSNIKKNKSDNRGIGNYLLYSLFNKSKVSALKNSLIDYGNHRLPQEIRGYYTILIEKSFQYPVIFLFTAFIIFFILNIISVFVILNYTVRKKKQKERYIRIYGKIYEETLLSYMFGEINWERANIKLKRKERKVNREILISILLNFHENLKGEVDKFIPEIYTKLGLQKDSLKATNSLFNYKKVQGIRELTYLYSKGAVGIISNFINDSNDNVRAEAQTAFIRLNPDNPFKFFQTLTKPFTRWTQLSAFNLIRVHQLPIPSFADFLNSKHPNIQNFSLRMIIYFQQLENVPEIIKMLDSKIDQTRFLSYRAINDLRLYEGKESIKNKFLNETDKNKLEIVKAFRNIGNLEDFDFLESIIKSESVSLKVEACRSMYFMNIEGRERLLKMKNESMPELELYIAHVTDSRN
jgi:hypothetical protein